MHTNRFIAGALLCAFFPVTQLAAKEQRGFQSGDDAASTGLPIHIVVLQERLHPQIQFNYADTSQAAGSIAGNMSSAGASFGQAVGTGVIGGLIAGAIINGVESAIAKDAVRAPYGLILQAQCDLPLVEAHHAMVNGALQGAQRLTQSQAAQAVVAKSGPRYVFTLSTSLTSDFSALMTTVNAAAYAPDADGDTQRKATWQDTLVVVSDGLWLLPKTQADIDRMVIAEQQRYTASGAEALINKVNSRGGSAAQWERKSAVQMVALHAKNMADAKGENWSDASTATQRAALWSDNHCALLEKTLQSNLQHANGMIQALFRHSLPVSGETQTPSAQVQTTQIGSTSTNPQTITETVVSVGIPEGSETEEIPTAPVRVIEAMDGGLYVSRLSIENINLGYRHMVLDE